MSAERALTPREVALFRSEIPRLIQQTYRRDQADTPLQFAIANADPRAICAPLTPAELDRFHRCPEISVQSAKAVFHPDADGEKQGVLTFEVRYDFKGVESSGAPLEKHVQAWLFLHAHTEGDQLFLTEIEAHPANEPLPDKYASRKQTSPRAAREKISLRMNRDDWKGCCWDTLIELVLEALFDR